jgi:hypothetical protein
MRPLCTHIPWKVENDLGQSSTVQWIISAATSSGGGGGDSSGEADYGVSGDGSFILLEQNVSRSMTATRLLTHWLLRALSNRFSMAARTLAVVT